MADQYNHYERKSDETSAAAPKAEMEAADRGLFDFMGKKEEGGKKCEGDVIAAEFDEKAKVSEEKEGEDTKKHETLLQKFEEFDEKAKVSEEKEGEDTKKHETLLQKFERSNSSSSSSGEEEIGEDGGKKKKKEKKEKQKDTNVPIEKCDEQPVEEAEEKKGFLDKIKEKLPGAKKPEDVASPPPTPATGAECATTPGAEEKEKKGFLDKIKEKIPGYSKGDEEKKENEGACN